MFVQESTSLSLCCFTLSLGAKHVGTLWAFCEAKYFWHSDRFKLPKWCAAQNPPRIHKSTSHDSPEPSKDTQICISWQPRTLQGHTNLHLMTAQNPPRTHKSTSHDSPEPSKDTQICISWQPRTLRVCTNLHLLKGEKWIHVNPVWRMFQTFLF